MAMLPEIDPNDYTYLAQQKIFHIGEFVQVFARLGLDKDRFVSQVSSTDVSESRAKQIYKDLRSGAPVKLNEIKAAREAFLFFAKQANDNTSSVIEDDNFVQPSFFIIPLAKKIFSVFSISVARFANDYNFEPEFVDDVLYGKRMPLSAALRFIRSVNNEVASRDIFFEPSEFIHTTHNVGRKSAARKSSPAPTPYSRWPPSNKDLEKEDKPEKNKVPAKPEDVEKQSQSQDNVSRLR